ncbi:hypothetical protein WN944_003232 [Citrus x changshan-huyou]|uniref:NB-ARC domain-containing protein n=1 Tax=Citrus x changshan-huyou TaxID=2935761 RepID=A0AAP0QHS9_9ROSI
MGGVGKTTLAQLVYKDDRVRRRFEIKAWTCVSEDFDVFRVTKSMLMSISNVTVNDNDLNSLQEKLEKELLKKKFLFVLGDLWNDNYNDWELLNRPFKAGTPGI